MYVKKTKSRKMERKLISWVEKDHSEAKSLSKKYKIKLAEIKAAMDIAGKNGKPCRSRAKVYEILRKVYPQIPALKTKKKKPKA